MNKLIGALCVCVLSVASFAQLSMRFDPVAHAGLITGNALDVSGFANGDPIYVEVLLENFEFTLAGFEFELRFPPYMTAMSVVDNDWNTGTGNVFTAGSFISALSVQQLPAAADGSLIANNNVTLINGEGRVRVGVLFTVTGDRPVGSVGTPNAGGVIGRLCFALDNSACDSSGETISLTMSGATAEIFADETATQVEMGTTNLTVVLNGAATIPRADGNHSGTRTFADVVPAARAALPGAGQCDAVVNAMYDWCTDAGGEFLSTFDGNCDGTISFTDVVINARLALPGGFNRTQFKKLEYFEVHENGSFVVNSEGRQGVATQMVLNMRDLKLSEPTISPKAREAGWAIVSDTVGENLVYILFNASMKSFDIPAVTVAYEISGKNAGIAMADVDYQASDLQLFKYTPLVEVFESVSK